MYSPFESGRRNKRPFGEIGKRAKLKILYQQVFRFDSGKGHKDDRAFSRELKNNVIMDTEKFNRYYASKPYFRIENPNPEWKKKRGYIWDRSDCSIRALANAISCEWVTAFDFLNKYARRDFNVCNDFGGFRKWVVEAGAKWAACKAVKGKSRMTVKEFAETHRTGRFVVQVAGHFTACVDGIILDSFNPGENAVVGYYDMAEFDINK